MQHIEDLFIKDERLKRENRERVAAYRAKQKKAGVKQSSIYVTDDELIKVKAYLVTLRNVQEGESMAII